MKIFINVIVVLLLSHPLFAKEVSCLGIETCTLLKSIKLKENIIIRPILFKKHGDHHHSNLRPKLLKQIANAKNLIIPPFFTKKEVKKLLNVRKNKKTLFLFKDSKSDISILEHFWINSTLICKGQAEISNWMSSSPPKCKDKKNELEKVYNKYESFLIISTHNYLKHFFQNQKVTYFPLSLEGHHQHVSPSKLKELVKRLKNKNTEKVLWIIDKNDRLLWKKIKKYYKKTHQKIEISLGLTTKSQIYETLDNLFEKLL